MNYFLILMISLIVACGDKDSDDTGSEADTSAPEDSGDTEDSDTAA